MTIDPFEGATDHQVIAYLLVNNDYLGAAAFQDRVQFELEKPCYECQTLYDNLKARYLLEDPKALGPGNP